MYIPNTVSIFVDTELMIKSPALRNIGLIYKFIGLYCFFVDKYQIGSNSFNLLTVK